MRFVLFTIVAVVLLFSLSPFGCDYDGLVIGSLCLLILHEEKLFCGWCSVVKKSVKFSYMLQ